MKKLLFTTAFLFTFLCSYAQWGTNTSQTGDISRTGNVGIGTLSPEYQLDVAGSISLLTGQSRLLINSSSTDDRSFFTPKNNNNAPGWSWAQEFGFHNSKRLWYVENKLTIGITNTEFDATSANLSASLIVNGKILCEEVEVVQNVLADYVFEKYYDGYSTLKSDYTMPTLEEVEAFTKANHHLPEVPSAAEVKENGMGLKEMSTILLQKVEELTLYTIEQEKRINALESKLAEKQ